MPDGTQNVDMERSIVPFEAKAKAVIAVGPVKTIESTPRYFENKRKSAEGKSPAKTEPRSEEKNFDNFTYLQIKQAKKVSDLSDADRKLLDERQQKLVADAHNAGHFDRAAHAITPILHENTWNTVALELQNKAKVLEEASHELEDYNPAWNGMVQDTVEGAAARIRMLGIDEKRKSVNQQEFEKWLETHNYNNDRIRNLVITAREKYIYNILPNDVTTVIGHEVRKQQIPHPGQNLKDINELLRKQKEQQDQFVQQVMEILAIRSGNGNLTAEDIARAMAMAQGEGSPEQQKEIYEQVEAGALAPVDMTLKVPYFLLIGTDDVDRKKVEEEWKARASIWSFAAHKQKIPSYEKMMENPEAFTLINKTLEKGMKIEGVFEAAAIYTAFISKKVDISFMRISSNDPDDPDGIINNVFEIKTNDQFKSFRKEMEILLDGLGIDGNQAETAEHVAWNIIYGNSVVEEFDSLYENGLAKRIPNAAPSNFKNPATWMVMHPQERLAAKASGDEPEDREAMGVVGDWSVNVASKDPEGKFKSDVLPHTALRNGLREIKFKPNTKIDSLNLPKDEGGRVSMFQVLEAVGLELLDSNQSRLSANDIPWSQVGNTPFSGYYFENVSPASKLFAVVMKGKESGISTQELGNIVKKCRLDRQTRTNLLKIWYGTKTNTNNLEYVGGVTDWGFLFSDFTKKHPNFFD